MKGVTIYFAIVFSVFRSFKKRLWVAFLLVLGSVQGEDGSRRVLTDLEGRTIEVRILAVDDESVAVLRGDGREFDIPLAKLSEEDREYLKTWKSPWKGGLESPVDAVVIVETSSGVGTGFFALEGGRVYLYTNQHVIDDLDGLKITDSRGAQVRTLGLEISRSQDLARFRVHPRKAFPLSDRVEPGEELTVLGNSEGAGVITHSSATVNGIGPDEIEVDSDFVPGNSGGPLLNSENEVVGVATYAIRGEERPDWVKEGTRYTEPRRFTIRPSRVNDWESVSISEYTSQIEKLKEAWRHFSRSYWTYYALAEWEGYISTIPDHWERPLQMILRNHNSRQKKPDYDTRYEQDGNIIWRITDSNADKKAASKRANLRSLDRYIGREFGRLFMLKSQIEIEYLLRGHSGVEALESSVQWLRGEIAQEIELTQ